MTSHSLIPFSFENCSVRVISHDDGSFSVVAKDVLLALGYTESTVSNLNDAVKHVPVEWKGRVPIPTPGGIQEMWCLTEPGLYFFLGRSDKPKALPMQKWIAGDVLPSIRKTGSYSLPGMSPTGVDPRFIEVSFSSCLNIARMCGITGNLALLSADNGTKALTGVSALALIGATHLLADERGRVYTPTELGKMMDPPLSPVKMNLLLEASGMQRKEMGGWLPTDEAEGLFEWADTGKRHSNGTPVKQLRWFKEVLNHVVHGAQRLAA